MNVPEEVKVISVHPAYNPNGETRVSVTFAAECPSAKPIEKNALNNQTITIIPGMGPGNAHPQVPMENRAIVYFTQGEWGGMKRKPNFGDIYELQTLENGSLKLTLKR